MVGAGLAGLACARRLRAAGVEVQVLEGSDGVGGRVRTDVVDGVQLDRGFQVLNTAYPEAAAVLDLHALDLHRFTTGALIRFEGELHRVVDPRRSPRGARATWRAPLGGAKAKLRLAKLSAADGYGDVRKVLARPETTTLEALHARGLDEETIERFVRPFLAGVFLEQELATSSRFFDLVWRSFVRGRVAVPARGMGQIAVQLAQNLDVQLDTTVTALPRARAVVVATDPAGAAALLPGLEVPVMRRVTTHYHLVTVAPLDEPAIVLPGDGSGPVVNTVVLTSTAPTYAPGRHLVSSSVLAADVPEADVRRHLGELYGADTTLWEHVAAYDLPAALPAMTPPLVLRKPVRASDGVYVCGDHRDTASIQGALVSGRRAADAVLEDLGVGRELHEA